TLLRHVLRLARMNKLRGPSKGPRRRSRPKASHCQVAQKYEGSLTTPNFRRTKSTHFAPKQQCAISSGTAKLGVSSTRSGRRDGSGIDWRDQDGNFEKLFRSACLPRCRLTALHKQRSV